MTIAIELKDLSKTFTGGKGFLGKPRNVVTAVNRVSLAVSQGETLGIVGESGCGKSTLAKMLVGLLQPTDGQIEIYGQPLGNLKSPQIGKHIQYVFQDPISSLNPRKTIRQIMHAPLKHLKNLPREVREEQIREIFEAVNLRYEFLDRYPHEFSGGQAQRIGIARALAASAKVIILDEPVSALDVSVQAQILNLLSELRAQFNLTFLFISHDLGVVKHMCDSVVVMYMGKVVEHANREQLFSAPKHPYTKTLLNAVPKLDVALDVTEVQNQMSKSATENSSVNGCKFFDRCPLSQPKCKEVAPELGETQTGHWVACHMIS